MNSRDYWERRAAQDMYDRMGTAEDTAAEMNAAIQQTSAYLEKEVKAVMRGMQSFGISEAEAREILNAAGDGTALQRLRKAAQQVGDPEKREALLNAINSAGAYRYRITRIEELNKDIVKQCRELYKTENRHITSALRNVAEDSYYHEIFSIQKGTGLGFSFSKFPRQDVDRILRSNWSGGNYSQRIWKDVNGMTARLKSELLVSMLSGRSSEKTARIFQEQFGVNAYCARRIVRTESAYVANAAQAKAYDEAGIDRYRFIATLDSRTCECCAALDGKVFELAKAKPGTNYPPMHPFCRSTTIADFGDDELEGLERRAKDKDGNTVKVPADMTYEQWKQGLSGNGGAVQLTFDDLEKSNTNGALTNTQYGGIIKSGRFNTTDDPMREVTGSAMSSNPDEVEAMKNDLTDSGVELIITDHDMAYAPGIRPGEPGQFLIDRNASFSAWCHEYKHFCDDRNDGFLGFRVFEDPAKCRQREIDAYQVEIDMAEKAGRPDIVERLKKLRDKEVTQYE
ncbi:MAG: minor capsid protein [Oscillospiraceae bacterium]|nr:minor capsid protein [Oscillospiraceae bacterium]